MLRLVQGDVGSGKTVVAALAALAAVEAGYQAALMAPTELLAEQHFRNFQRWMQPLGVDVVWLAGKLKGKSRASAKAALTGSANIAIGTHALMQEGVAFAKLGLVDHRRTASIRRASAFDAARQRAQRRSGPASTRAHCDADSAHVGDDGVCRSRCVRH